ncbi:hypothetical protein N7534_012093 [Penicillium rubens]|nr:hypothetical protein N7534_012093 [Penicillium rubens]
MPAEGLALQWLLPKAPLPYPPGQAAPSTPAPDPGQPAEQTGQFLRHHNPGASAVYCLSSMFHRN